MNSNSMGSYPSKLLANSFTICWSKLKVVSYLKLTCLHLTIGRAPKGNDGIPTMDFQGRTVSFRERNPLHELCTLQHILLPPVILHYVMCFLLFISPTRNHTNRKGSPSIFSIAIIILFSRRGSTPSSPPPQKKTHIWRKLRETPPTTTHYPKADPKKNRGNHTNRKGSPSIFSIAIIILFSRRGSTPSSPPHKKTHTSGGSCEKHHQQRPTTPRPTPKKTGGLEQGLKVQIDECGDPKDMKLIMRTSRLRF